MATAIDDNAEDEQSGKSMCRLLNIRCTSYTTKDSNEKIDITPKEIDLSKLFVEHK